MEEFYFHATLACTSAIYSQRYRPAAVLFAIYPDEESCIALRCAQIVETSSVLPMVQSALQNVPSLGTWLRSFKSQKRPTLRHSLVIGQAWRALCCISLAENVDILRYHAGRLAVVCALDRDLLQYRQASIAILNSWVAQSADSLPAARSPCVSYPPPCWPSTPANGRLRLRN